MSKYCKAYPILRLRQFSGWTENADNARNEEQDVDGQKVRAPRQLTSTSFLYVQDNLVVTDGVFRDENIIFDDLTPQWEAFCREELKFLVPGDDPIDSREPDSAATKDGEAPDR